MWIAISGLFMGLVMSFCALGIDGVDSFIELPIFGYKVLFCLFIFSTLLPFFWISIMSAGSKNKPVAMAFLQSVIEDKRLSLYMTFVFLSSLLGLIAVCSTVLPPLYAFAIATCFIGCILGLFSLAFYRIYYCRTAEGVAGWLFERMQSALKVKNGKVLVDSFEMMFPFLIGSMKSGDVASLRAISQKASNIVEVLLRAVGKLPLFSAGSEHDETMLDRFTFAEAMTAKRLSWIINEAREKKNPAVIEEVVRLYVKLFLVFHSHHASLGNLLLLSLCQQTQQGEDRELTVEVVMTLSEVAKSLIDRSIDTGVSEKETVVRTIKLLEIYIKETFRRDKSISAALLMQPFAEIGQLLGGTRYNTLLNREEILIELRRILSQFAALETVTGRFEMGAERTDTAATFTQDSPYASSQEDSK